MQELVIKIPDEAYNQLLKEQHLPNWLNFEYLIMKGIPLPKEHGDLIDKKIFENEKKFYINRKLCNGYETISVYKENVVNNAPIILKANKGDE